ncbi:MAG TPA: helix-turn-helix domain-containing protein [Actinomycetes bacterium]|nr:helix-turn-helix domain-containing protein [Actinomycetes bacterium]
MEKGQGGDRGDTGQPAEGATDPGSLTGAFLTVAEVASLMRVSKMTVYRLVHAGDLPAVRVGRSFRVPEEAVRRYLRDSFVEAG